MARFSRFSRFSATPRRRWSFRRRSASHGTLTPRLQVAQFNLAYDHVILTNQTDITQPSFTLQAMTPWENLSQSGYDRSCYIHGIVWNLNVFVLSWDDGEGETPGPVPGSRAFTPINAEWFVDGVLAGGAPSSYQNDPYGPFVSTPPIASPLVGPADSEVFPTRILRRKTGRLRVGVMGTQSNANAERDADAAGYSRFEWSGTLRKRFAVDDRQGLFFGLHTINPFNPVANIDLILTVWLNGHMYYRLRR